MAALVVTVAAVLGLSLAVAGPASASAYGCTGYGSGVSWQGMYVKNGTWCGGVVGGGTYVSYIYGNFYTHLPWDGVCNFSMRADFYDAYGNWYGWRQTGTVWRCSLASDVPSMGVYQNVRPGKVRISLISNGGTVSAVEHSIH
jgi:hypothetical protein